MTAHAGTSPIDAFVLKRLEDEGLEPSPEAPRETLIRRAFLDLTGLLKTLKQYHPHIATVVVTERANAQLAIDLINEGQVYRMLIKPVRMGSCRLSVDSAIGRYWQLKKTPAAVKRFAGRPCSSSSTRE